MTEQASHKMLQTEAQALVRRVSDKVYKLHTGSANRQAGDDLSHNIYYESASCHIHRGPPGNAVYVRVFVPPSVGARFIAHSQYFQPRANNTQFDKVIHHEGEEEELTSRTLEFVSLYLARNAEK
jgi:hypothetical protein